VTGTTPGRREGPKVAVASAEHGRHWGLFADWCTASGHSCLPASPDTLLAFLAELPVGAATVARRVRAIDTAHRAAGLSPPGEAPELDEILGRHPSPARFDSGQVARALAAIPVGGWPAGTVGRRDAAIVALICAGGLTRSQVQALRTDLGLRLAAPLSGHQEGKRCTLTGVSVSVPRTETAGSCPACALSRWLRVAVVMEDRGWRTVRAQLADLGEVTAGDVTAHDCAEPLPETGLDDRNRWPLFTAIDRHGAPESGYILSARSITAIIATRLHARGDDSVGDWWNAGPEQHPVPAGQAGHRWGVEERRRAAERYAEVEATLDEMEEGVEAIMAKVRAAMGDDLGPFDG